jgi:mediator of RNA polymerase II transcription subunit 16
MSVGFTQEWISELIRILKIQVDFTEDTSHEMMRNGNLQACLSIMHSLGFKGESQPRSFQSKFAMLCLNVRNVVMLISIASNTSIVREKVSPLDEPGKFTAEQHILNRDNINVLEQRW